VTCRCDDRRTEMDASIFASDLCEAQSSCHSSPPLNTHYTQEEEEEGIPRATTRRAAAIMVQAAAVVTKGMFFRMICSEKRVCPSPSNRLPSLVGFLQDDRCSKDFAICAENTTAQTKTTTRVRQHNCTRHTPINITQDAIMLSVSRKASSLAMCRTSPARGWTMLLLRQQMSTTNSPETAAAAPTTVKLNFSLPHETIYKGAKVYSVILPGMGGEYGVTANHVPYVAQLKPGVLQILHDEGSASDVEKYFVSGGYAITHPDSTTVRLCRMVCVCVCVLLDALDIYVYSYIYIYIRVCSYADRSVLFLTLLDIKCSHWIFTKCKNRR
jgi:hypothetical protein